MLMVEFKVLLGIILVAIAITLPFAWSSGEWKYWVKSWIMGIIIVLFVIGGLWLMGVR